MSELITKLKAEIFDQLKIVDVDPETFGPDDPLFGEGLGLDSIDSLELIVLLGRSYGIKVKNPEEGKEIFTSLNTLAAFIEANQK